MYLIMTTYVSHDGVSKIKNRYLSGFLFFYTIFQEKLFKPKNFKIQSIGHKVY